MSSLKRIWYYAPTFREALFITAKCGNPNVLLDEQINKVCYIHTMQYYYSSTKKE